MSRGSMTTGQQGLPGVSRGLAYSFSRSVPSLWASGPLSLPMVTSVFVG